MTGLRAPLLLALVVATGCSGFGEVPELPANTAAVLSGPSARDLWFLNASLFGEVHTVLHGPFTDLRAVAVPDDVRRAWTFPTSHASALRDALYVRSDGALGGPAVWRVDADGHVATLDVSGIFPEVSERRVVGSTMLAQDGQVWLTAWCNAYPSCVNAQRLYRLEGERFVEVTAPDTAGAWELVAVIRGELWLVSQDPGGPTVHRRSTSGWVQLPRPVDPRRFSTQPSLITFTGPDDVWFGGSHWNGQDWAQLQLPDDGFGGALLATAAGEAQLIDVRSMQRITDVPDPITFALRFRAISRGGVGAAKERTVVHELPRSGYPAAARLGDGSVLFLVNGHLLVPVSQHDAEAP
jgi:hypothetical protein